MFLLSIAFLMFTLYLLQQMEPRKNIKKVYGLWLPILEVIPNHGELIVRILFAIAVLLLLYIIYLYLRRNKKPKKAKEKKQEEKKEVINNHTTIIKEKEPVYIYTSDKEKEEVKEETKEEPTKEEKTSTVVVAGAPTKTKDVKVAAKPIKKLPRTILNYSFQSRVHLAIPEALERYETVRAKLLSFEDVKDNETWKYERYIYRSKSVVKIKLQGKTMRLFFNLDPKTLDEKYGIEDVSETKAHENTPSLLVVKGPRGVKYALELIDLYMKNHKAKTIENYVYHPLKFKRLSKLQLLKANLIKTNDATFIERLEEEERLKALNDNK